MAETSSVMGGFRQRSRVRGSDVVQEQAVFMHQADTWLALADAIAPAANAYPISILNATGSGKVVQLLELRYIPLALTAVTGVGVRFEVHLGITAHSAGTAITPRAFDSTQTALPAQVTVRTGGTITGGTLLYPFAINNDEIPLTLINHDMAGLNVLPALRDSRAVPLTLRPGEGLGIKQITSSTVGSFGWMCVFTIEDTWT